MKIVDSSSESISSVEIPQGSIPELKPVQVMMTLARLGMTNQEIAETLGISYDAFFRIFIKNPKLKDLLDEARDEPNHKVAASLFKRAMGYQTREIIQKQGKPVQVTIKEVPADVVACIFWLKNRDPKKWRDIIEHSHSLRDRMERAHQSVSSRNSWALSSGDD